MIEKYNGEYGYNDTVISGWDSNSIGVYYLWEGGQIVYVGSGTGEDGIRGRLLSHLSMGTFPEVTKFGYKIISTDNEALLHEENEIKTLNPKYNKQHNN